MNASRAESAVALSPSRSATQASDTFGAFGAAVAALKRLWADHQRSREELRKFQSIAHLNPHMLKDIGAPHWLVAEADLRRDTQRLQWIDQG